MTRTARRSALTRSARRRGARRAPRRARTALAPELHLAHRRLVLDAVSLRSMSVYRASRADHLAAITVAARTDTGLSRKHNEDTFLVSNLAEGTSFGLERV